MDLLKFIFSIFKKCIKPTKIDIEIEMIVPDVIDFSQSRRVSTNITIN